MVNSGRQRELHRRVAAGGILLASLLSASMVLVSHSIAGAATSGFTTKVQGTWNIHSTADLAAASKTGRTIANTTVTVVCQAINAAGAATVDGYGSSAIIDYIDGIGYISDLGVVGTATGTRDTRLPDCSKQSPVSGSQLQGTSADHISGGSTIAVPSQVASGSGWVPNCSGNAYAAAVEVQPFEQGQFEIKVTPTSNARHAWPDYVREATDQIWHAVQNCVSGLYGTLADSIYEQINCHIYGSAGGPLNLGGETYDFESWRGTTDWANALASKCNWGGWPYKAVGQPMRPDRGVLDLPHIG